MGTSPFWIGQAGAEDPTEWNTCACGDVWLPGLCRVTIGKIERDVDKKKSKSTSGGTMTDNGYKPTSCTIEVTLWLPEHHAQWLQVLPKINPRREGATKDPFELRYPSVQEFGLGPMFVSAIDPGGPPTSSGLRRIKIQCDEWWAKPKPVKKGSGAVKKSDAATPRTPLGNYMQPGVDPLKSPGSGLADPTDMESVMGKANNAYWSESEQRWIS